MELDNYKIYVNSDLTVIEQRILVDIGFILGFYTISSTFPVTTVNSGKNTIKIVKNIGQEVAVHGSIIEVAVPEPDKYNDTLKEVAEIFQAETEITEREVVTPRGYESASQYAKEWKDSCLLYTSSAYQLIYKYCDTCFLKLSITRSKEPST